MPTRIQGPIYHYITFTSPSRLASFSSFFRPLSLFASPLLCSALRLSAASAPPALACFSQLWYTYVLSISVLHSNYTTYNSLTRPPYCFFPSLRLRYFLSPRPSVFRIDFPGEACGPSPGAVPSTVKPFLHSFPVDHPNTNILTRCPVRTWFWSGHITGASCGCLCACACTVPVLI